MTWRGGSAGRPGAASMTTARSKEVMMSERRGTDRRTFLKTAGAAAGATALAGFPAVLRAQTPTFIVGVVHPVTVPIAEPGEACRLVAQLAGVASNAYGDNKSDSGLEP